ncbi:MAG: hypothetical protein KJ574_00310, partial [Nanoarchaeota archaeon]|nr:hypothetical protein [Nanoarchaeota archaeon]
DKIIDYLTRDLGTESKSILYVKNSANKDSALRELIEHTLEANRTLFEDLWVGQHRYANYLRQTESAVREGLDREKNTGALYRKKTPKSRGIRPALPDADRELVYN